MANNRIQVKRTSVSGRLPNTTNVANSSYIAAGELALNLTDGILYSSNGSSIIPIGANNVNINVSGNLTVTSVIANGSLGTSNQVLTSNGTGVYWSTPVGGGGGGTGAIFEFITNQFTGNGSANTYALSQSTTTNNALVFINGVEQVPNSAYTISGSTLTFASNISNGSVVEVRIPTFGTYSGSISEFQTYVFTASNNQTTFSGADNNSKTLSYTAGYITVYLNGVKLVDTVDYSANNGTSVVLTSGAANADVLEVVSQAMLTIDQDTSNTYLIGNTYLYSANNLTTTSATLQNLDSFAANTYRSASYFVQVTDNTNGQYHAQNITLIHDGANVNIVEFGAIYTANSLATFDATISSGIVYLQVNPVTANSTIRVARTAMVV